MKSRILLLALMLSLPAWQLFSQTPTVSELVENQQKLGRQFAEFHPFQATQQPAGIPAPPASKADYLLLDKQVLSEIMQYRPAALELHLPYQGSELVLELVRQNVVSEDFTVVTSDRPGQPAPFDAGAHYRGIIKGNPHTLAAISFFSDEIMGVVAHPFNGHLNLGRLDLPKNRTQYVLFSDHDFTGKLPIGCDTDDAHMTPQVPRDRGLTNVNGCVRVYFEADKDLYSNKGSVTATVNYITGFFNSVSTLYQNEQVSIVISQIYVWTTADGYPETSSSDALYAFQSTRTTFNGDIAHLVTLDAGNLGGVAFIDILCVSGYNYAFSNIGSSYNGFPTYSWTVEVVTHEMGHSMSSHHTHWCGWSGGALDNCYTTEGGCAAGPAPTNGGTIMSYCHLTGYGINFNNGFGTQPGDAIRSGVTAASCLSATCTTNPCPPPNSFTLTATTGTSATFTWSAASGNNSFKLRYQLYGGTSWTTITNVTSPYTLSGLASGQKYAAEIQAVCANGSSDMFVGIFFKTTSNCAEPTAQTVTSITGTSAQLNWTENAGATSWQVKYGAPGFDPLSGGTQIAVSSKPYTLTGLSGGTTYDWYVRSNCAPPASGNSGWTGPNTFTTTIANDDVANATLLNLDVLYDVTNAGATIQSGEPNPSVSPGRWGYATTNTVWFKFVAPTSGTVTISTDFLPQGTNDDTQLALYNVGTVSNFSTYTLLASDDDNGTQGSSYNSVFSYSGLTSGSTYYIQADGFNTTDGTFQIMITETVMQATLNTSCVAYPTQSVNGTTNPNRWWSLYTTSTGISIGQLVGAIKTPQNLGTVTLKAKGGSAGQASGNLYYMGRYYDIQSSTPPTQPVTVRMFYNDADLSALQTLIGISGLTINDLDALHYDGINEDCSYSNNGSNTYTAFNNPLAQRVASTDKYYLEYTINSFSELLATYTYTPLPVELTGFHAAEDGPSNRVSWETGAEKDIDVFVVQRSSDGSTDWTETGREAARNAGQTAQHYILEDTRPLPVGYYRLLMQDKNGGSEYSAIARVARKDASFQIASIFPVPAHEELNIKFNLPADDDVQVNISDLTGRLLRSQSIPAQKGLNQTSVDLSGLPAAGYLVELQNRQWTAPPRFFVKQ
jgi:hypothetical protein